MRAHCPRRAFTMLAVLSATAIACGGTSDPGPPDAPQDTPANETLARDAPDDRMCERDEFGPSCTPCRCENGGECSDGASGDGSCTCPLLRSGPACEQRCDLAWGDAPDAPIEAFAFNPERALIANDPSVLVEGTGFRMWFSLGEPLTDGIPVRIHEARSNDGERWTVLPTPQLSPGAPGAWDDQAVETPSVLRDGEGRYHLYYSGRRRGDGLAILSIGHATSDDGVTWVRDPANPIIQTAAAPERSDWGQFTAAEPGALYNPRDGKIHLYYASAGGSAEHAGDFAILYATSDDGSRFEHHRDADGNREPVWSLQPSYAGAGFRGYSGPSVTLGADGATHLVHTVVFNPGDAGFEQIAIASARSEDGIRFEERAPSILARGDAPWIDRAVIGPHLRFHEGRALLWAMAEPTLVSFDEFTQGIVRIVGDAVCP